MWGFFFSSTSPPNSFNKFWTFTCVHVPVPKEFLINMLMNFTSAAISILMVYIYTPTRPSVHPAPLYRTIVAAWLVATAWRWHIREVFSIKTPCCHSVNHAQNRPHSLFRTPHFMDLVECAVHQYSSVFSAARAASWAAVLTNTRSITSGISKDYWCQT